MQIKGTLKRCDAKKDPYACFLMKRLKEVLNEILNKASYFTKQSDPEYFEGKTSFHTSRLALIVFNIYI